MTSRGNTLVPDNKNSGESWDTDSMIWTAKSLQRVAKELERHGEPPQSDPLLFSGKLLAVPVLLTLATEIALKAWQCRERKGKPDHGHDLLELFDGLGEATRTQLAAKFPEVPNPLPGFPPIRPGMRKTLCFHRKAFVHWRYLYEDPRGVFQTPALNEVIAAIIDAYDKAADESP